MISETNQPGRSLPVRRATPADAGIAAHLLHDFNTEYATPTPGVQVLAARLRTLTSQA